MSAGTQRPVSGADTQSPALRQQIRDLILCLADSKRLLGMRYAEWILGAPELEAGIACASMAQDEWGHGRLLYALLKEFGDDVDAIEHGREPEQYCNLVALDGAPQSWPEFAALNALADTALTIQLEALTESAYAPLRQRVQKLLEEEQFHRAHGAAWVRRLARGSDQGRAAVSAAVDALLPQLLQWYGPDDAAGELREQSIVSAAGSDLRTRFLDRVAPLLAELDASAAVVAIEPSFDNFDAARRRPAGRAPDAATIQRIRGDRNRAFLMD